MGRKDCTDGTEKRMQGREVVMLRRVLIRRIGKTKPKKLAPANPKAKTAYQMKLEKDIKTLYRMMG